MAHITWTEREGETKATWGPFAAYVTQRADRHSPAHTRTWDATLYRDGRRLGRMPGFPTRAEAMAHIRQWHAVYWHPGY